MLEFTTEEKKLFELIKLHALSLENNVVPRLAGGFVRDKILGIKSSDIDIAFENISGLAFAEGLSEKLKNHPTVHKISANPEKSKHLETAILSIYGFDIDFVHLRTESYTNTRIPVIIPGTPKEDAERRDITINSLFYNLITEEVEDFTGRGLHDIKNQLIDTPLDPKITLFDDPLRIIRIFRFKSKFGFKISERIYEAIKNEKIKEALEKKVSNERNLIEINKMLKYPDGEAGLMEIVLNDYIVPVFKPGIEMKYNTQQALSYLKLKNEALIQVNESIFENKKKDHIFEVFDTETNQSGSNSILKLYIILQYFIGYEIPIKKGKIFLNAKIVKESLKADRHIIKAVESIEEYIKSFGSGSINSRDIDPVEFIVKSGVFWFDVLIILYSTTGDKNYLNLVKSIFTQNLQQCYSTKPLINGDVLLSINTKQHEFREKLNKALIIQIKNPKMTKSQILALIANPEMDL